ncbi:N-acetylmannosamine kinase [Vibrio sp. NTOU-M3]|uniref:N-acetylmannosamine kinase n=1 Tax=Vibrio sp. NTOU-M3 TaxID=3234954 RepID=UPI00349F9DAC
MHTLAIDIGGTKIALGLFEDGKMRSRRQLATPIATNTIIFAEEILEHCQDWLEVVDNIGISTTGLVTPEGISAINPDTLDFPTPFPLHTALNAITQKPVEMLNDAQAAAWFEYRQLQNRYQNIAYITVSTGVGGGIVLDGKLLKGASNLAGHVGHTVLSLSGPECGCGQRGCVEAMASGTAIHKAALEVFDETISNIELFELAEKDLAADHLICQSAAAIATLCCNLKASLDLDVVVLGGGIGLAKRYLQRVEHHISQKPAVFQVPIIRAKGDYDACLYGAAQQFQE